MCVSRTKERYTIISRSACALFCLFGNLLDAHAFQTGTDDQGALEQQPNIIFILTDDQRFDALGHAGNALISTPEMDRLAAAGTYFKNAMVTTPICAASRASILTGLQERTHNFNFQTGDIRAAYMETSYPTLLRNHGYTTAFYGKYGVLYQGLDQQFDVFESYDRNGAFPDRRGYYYKTLGSDTVHLTRYTGQKALDFINGADGSKPFCLSLSFSAPHAHDNAREQYFWQTESDSLLQDIQMPGPELGEGRYFKAQPKMVREGFNRLRWTWRYDTPKKYQHSVKGYYRMISGIDREIGKIREQLEKKGLAENTVIILMGDNGYFLGERQLAGKWLLYDNSVRVPLIVYDPRVKTHYTSAALALNIDVPSTILDLAGLPQPDTWQGKSLLPIVRGKTADLERDTVLLEHLWEFDHIPPSEGVRTHQWKYFRYVNDKSIEELYSLKDDPREIDNLAKNPKYAIKLRAFREKTDALAEAYSDAYSEGPANLGAVLPKNGKVGYQWELPKNGVAQTAYQLLVASSEEKLKNNIGDVWNSGRVLSDKTTAIVHRGKTLKKGQTYFFKVRLWDGDNRLSKYSQYRSFGMPQQAP